jgi:hypothetical protein
MKTLPSTDISIMPRKFLHHWRFPRPLYTGKMIPFFQSSGMGSDSLLNCMVYSLAYLSRDNTNA